MTSVALFENGTPLLRAGQLQQAPRAEKRVARPPRAIDHLHIALIWLCWFTPW